MVDLLLLCEYPTLNGGENSLRSVLPTLIAQGFCPRFLVPREGSLAKTIRSLDLRVDAWPWNPSGDTSWPLERRREWLGEFLKQSRPDLLHANSLSMSRLSGPVARKSHIPSLGHLRDIIGLSHQAIEDLNSHTRLLAVSQATRDFHVSAGLNSAKTFVLYNGIDLQKFSPQKPNGELRKELGLPRDTLLIGSVGQLVQRKGQDLLVKAASLMNPQWTNVHFLFFGERHSQKDEAIDYENQLRQSFESSSALQGRGHFLGFRENMDRWLPELTILVHSARQEPLGRVLLEAAGAGIPIIATRVGGTEEIFPGPHPTAFLIPPNNAQELAQALETLLKDQALRETLARQARKRMEKYFDMNHSGRELIKHYQEVLSSSAKAPNDSERSSQLPHSLAYGKK